MKRGRVAVTLPLLGFGGGLWFWFAHHGTTHDAPANEPAVAAVTQTVAAPAAQLPAPSAPSAKSSTPTPQTEATLMDELRRFKATDPQFAVDRAREGNARFPNSVDAPERTSILIHALSDLGQTSEARGIAEDMVNRYPNSTWVREIERFTGAHRHRNVHVDSSGRLTYDEVSATAP